MNSKLVKINCVSRYGLAFLFFYHGLVPKIIFYSPIERSLVEAHTIKIAAPIISSVGGVLEIVLAFAIIFFTKYLIPVYIAAISLLALLFDVGLVKPELLVEAFNPVSTNITALVLCYVVYLSQAGHTSKRI